MTGPKLNIRIDYEGHKLGPGKAGLLEAIAKHRSISAAARANNLSYGKALRMIREMEAMFGTAVVKTQTGGAARGGASLTQTGNEIAALYKAIVEASDAATQTLRDKLADLKA